MEKSKTKTTPKENKMCSKHNKPHIYEFSAMNYCKDCLDDIFRAVYKYGTNFDKEVDFNG